jgi:invasion protein IalB
MRAAFLSVALAALVAVPAIAQPRATPAQPAGPRRLGDFQDWIAAVHTENGQKVCYAFTRATRSDPQRNGVILTVTHRTASRDQVALSAGYAYPRNAAVTLSVGPTQLAFYTSASSAFARDGRAAVAAFRNGAQAVARGPRTGGRGTATDTFSLTGFTAAYEAISQECPAARR